MVSLKNGYQHQACYNQETFVSIFLGIYLSDLLCSASYTATSSDARFDFFNDFAARLRAMPEVTRLRSVQKAHMPVIKLTFRSATESPGKSWRVTYSFKLYSPSHMNLAPARSVRVDITYAHVPSTDPLCRMALNGFKSGEAVLAR